MENQNGKDWIKLYCHTRYLQNFASEMLGKQPSENWIKILQDLDRSLEEVMRELPVDSSLIDCSEYGYTDL